MARSENHLEERIIEACKIMGFRCPKGRSDNNKGYPDRQIFNTRLKEVHWVEVKNDTYYEITDTQIEWKNKIESCGGKFFLLNGDKEVNEYIKNYIFCGELK